MSLKTKDFYVLERMAQSLSKEFLDKTNYTTEDDIENARSYLIRAIEKELVHAEEYLDK